MTKLDSPVEINSLKRAQRVDQLCDEFESAWQSGTRPNWREWLGRVPIDEQAELLVELLPLDVAYRARRGERPVIEEYSDRVPLAEREWLSSLIQSNVGSLDGGGAASRDSERNQSGETLAQKGPGEVAVGDVEPFRSPLPDYEIVGELGRGAMGVVYLARHTRLGRTVALKMVLAGGHASAGELARFRAEAEAGARLHHPHIVQIYDYGEHEGRPYLSLEYVSGGTLAERISGVAQPPREAARLVEALAEALRHAHDAGIVHRDLKPANILMSPHGVPKISDFGLAKQVESAHGATVSGMVLGTPRYMAPEQAAGQSHAVGPAADIHALGAILYELVTGQPPFQAASLTELFALIRDSDPAPPSRLRPAIPRDLETICLKCLQKSPAARYSSAAELADDLRRFLAEEPIRARPIGPFERAWRWCRRNPRIATLEAALVTILVVVAFGSFLAAGRFRRISTREQASAQAAEVSRLETRLELVRSRITVARMLRRGERVGQYYETMSELAKARDELRALRQAGLAIPAADWQSLRNEAASALLVPDLRVARRWPRRDERLPEIHSDPERSRYARKRADGKGLELLRYGEHEPFASVESPDGSQLASFCFSPDGSRLGAATSPPGQIHVWDVSESPRFVRSLNSTSQWPALDRSGRHVALTSGSNGARVVRVDDGEQVAETSLAPSASHAPFHPSRPWLALLSARRLAVFDYEQGETLWSNDLPETSVANLLDVTWNLDGSSLAVVSDRGLQMVDGRTGAPTSAAIASFDASGMQALPIGSTQLVATTDWSKNLRLFNAQTGRLQFRAVAALMGRARVSASHRLSLGYETRDFVEWELREGCQSEFAHLASDHVALNHAGDLLVVYRALRDAAIFAVPSGEWLGDLPETWGDLPLGFEADDRALLMYGRGKLVRLPLERRRAETGKDVIRLGPAFSAITTKMRERWGMNSAGTRIVVPGFDQGGQIVHLDSKTHEWQRLQVTPPQRDTRFAAISPDGEAVVFGSHENGEVALYDPQDGRRLRTVSTNAGVPRFSPRGAWLVVQTPTAEVDVYETRNWSLRKHLPGMALAFSEDEQWAAVNFDSNWIAIFETSTWREIGRLEIQDRTRVQPLAFTRDNSALIALALDTGRIVYVDLTRVRRELKALDLDWDAPLFSAGATAPRPQLAFEFAADPT